jgi:hypothetical protein
MGVLRCPILGQSDSAKRISCVFTRFDRNIGGSP